MPLYRGWAVVVACGIIASFSWGLGFYGLGVYLHALSRLHGWSAGLISVAVTTYYTLSAGCLVVVGGLIDRHGPRGVLTYGVVTMAAAVALLGVITAPWQLFAVYLVMATSWSCLSSTGLSSTLLPWFGRRQGLAMTLALTGASVGGMVLVPILVALVQRHGFRLATLAAAAALLAIGLPLVWGVIGPRPAPEQVASELRRDGPSASAAEGPRQARIWTRPQVLREPRLWTLMVPFALALAAQVGFLVHQISVLEPAIGEGQAALTVSATTVAALLGRIVLGVLSDRVDLRKLSAVNIGAQGAALAAMAAWPSSAVLIAASLVFGLGVGNLITFPPLLARAEFGPRSFGTVFGLVGAATQAGVALGPGLVGVLHDALGSYQPALWCLVTLEVLAAAAVLCGRTRDDGGLEPRGAARAS
ncbi:MAG TPA: MFS transporter [Methylomirabilota bacterium]|jgi:MFS family permease|nr:MFS transporter [Methylomirabilota bacterium]